MNDDYRLTEYDVPNINLKEKKKAVELLVKTDHPRARDMHAYISQRGKSYRKEFIKAYQGKCAYCGVSTFVISSELFEVDHFRYEKGFPTKADAGFMDNLVLACHSCNHAKRDFVFSHDNENLLHPDNTEIKSVFCRDDDYYIQIQDEYAHNTEIEDFYTKLDLGGEIHRLDYLLMSMHALCDKIGTEHKATPGLEKALNLLRTKRNIGISRRND